MSSHGTWRAGVSGDKDKVHASADDNAAQTKKVIEARVHLAIARAKDVTQPTDRDKSRMSTKSMEAVRKLSARGSQVRVVQSQGAVLNFDSSYSVGPIVSIQSETLDRPVRDQYATPDPVPATVATEVAVEATYAVAGAGILPAVDVPEGSSGSQETEI